MDRNNSAVTGLIEKTQADKLPLNGCNWASLTAYIPGAIDTGGSNQRSVRFAGRGLDDSNFTYDGVDATNIVNQTQRAWARLAIPLGAIQEFSVNTQLSTADVGATGGAQLAVTSNSGTNSFHGQLFEFLRNNVLDAPEPTWASNGIGQQPPLRLNQFGGSLGGPIVRDKTFFYFASEAYRQVWGYPVSGDVPSAAFKATVPTSSPTYPVGQCLPWSGSNNISDALHASYRRPKLRGLRSAELCMYSGGQRGRRDDPDRPETLPPRRPDFCASITIGQSIRSLSRLARRTWSRGSLIRSAA